MCVCVCLASRGVFQLVSHRRNIRRNIRRQTFLRTGCVLSCSTRVVDLSVKLVWVEYFRYIARPHTHTHTHTRLCNWHLRAPPQAAPRSPSFSTFFLMPRLELMFSRQLFLCRLTAFMPPRRGTVPIHTRECELMIVPDESCRVRRAIRAVGGRAGAAAAPRPPGGVQDPADRAQDVPEAHRVPQEG